MNKIIMINLDFFIIADLYFSRVKSLYKNLFTVLGKLFIIIFLVTFFNFCL